ncbi:ROK family protein [Streptomyces sp. HU2014]|uniref:ROK family transcriptional regulator n=1 Tax=Streptomyces albireticuli TaxID=1940 RepID=A0A1Z2KWH8_9ACTN|nr:MULTISPECIES: ROK family protein [Streptomyces]ARZ66321.1 ROK family transcriptional regulator [Streptomyces albireticuli]UQI46552.1 ROK family protein [Streptomyces sp. HU2014]
MPASMPASTPVSVPASPDPGLVAALDIGGTKIAGALVDSRGRLLARARRPTPAREDGATVMGAVAEVLDALAADGGWPRVRAVGIGSAGPVDASRGTVSPVNVPGWRGYPLVEEVARRVAGRPVTLVGDGVAMTAAEHWQGAARGRANALCMVVSTGVGGGLVLDGRLHTGPTGNAGHIGHISVDLDGDACPCGARGCVERIASGPNIARRALDAGWRPGPDGDRSAAAVAAAARAGDAVALASFERAAQALAAGIAATATLVEIEVAVIGGGVAGAGDILFAPLRARLRDYATLSFAAGVEVLPARLGPDAGLVGAAAAAAQGTGLWQVPGAR